MLTDECPEPVVHLHDDVLIRRIIDYRLVLTLLERNRLRVDPESLRAAREDLAVMEHEMVRRGLPTTVLGNDAWTGPGVEA